MKEATKTTNVFIKLFNTGNRIIGYEVSNDGNFAPPRADESESTTLEPPKPLDSSLNEISNEYVTSVLTYLDFMPMMLMVAPTFSIDPIVSAMRTYLEKNRISKTAANDSEIFEIAMSDYREFARLAQHLYPSSDVEATIARNAIMGLVSLLDVLITNLSCVIILQKAHLVEKSERQLSLREILSFKSFEELRDSIVDGELDKLAYKNFEERIEWIEKATGLEPISKEYPAWGQIVELFQRRNLFAHTSGHVSRPYIEYGRRFGWPEELLQEGKKLHVDPKYYKDAVRLAFEFGVKLIHVVRKKLGPKTNPDADHSINEVGFKLLVRGDYYLAEKILSFAYNLRDVEDRAKKIACINLANSRKLTQREKDCHDLLASHDWSAASRDFHICIAAIKGETERVISLMNEIGRSGEVGESAYREWPAFYHVRSGEKFKLAYETVFGVPYRPSAKLKDAWNDIGRNLGIKAVVKKKRTEKEVIDVSAEQTDQQPSQTS